MINTSSAYKNTLYNGHRNFIRKASIRLTDNTEIQITDADICQGGFKFDSATTSSGSFEIGNVIIEKFTILLNNRDDKFSSYDFYNATITVYAGIILDDGSEEWLRKGFYTVKEPDFSDSVITLGCYDNSKKFDIPYTNSKLTYPATRKQIVADICQVCGVTDNTGEFDGYNETVEKRPEDNNLSCRDILSFIAQISGLYGRCDNTGGFKFAWYEKIQYEGNNSSSVANLDGGNFTDYSSGDTADGGDFTDYSSGDTYDGGILVRNSPDLKGNFHNVYSTASSKPSTDDITITGIKVVTTTVQTVITETETTDPDTGETTTETTSSENTVAFEAVSGSNEYMLVVTDNPLVNDSNAQSIADHLYSKIGGMTFRPMTLSALADPSMEAGDPMVFTDRKGNSYESYVTTLSYTMGQYANMTCDAETPLSRKKNSETMSQALKNAIEMENAVERKYTRYAQAVDQLNQIAANALGFYETIDVASDGSKIVYMHDKPKLEDSEIVYKRSIDGFFISRDGGKTYTAGFDSNGNAVVNILSAIGINFDWAYGGTLTLGGDANGNGVLNIVDENGNPVVVGDNNGLVIYKGSISFEDITDSNGNTVEKRVTKITEDTVTTEYVDALEVTAKKVSADWVYAGNIKASQIYGDTLTLGGNNNANGQLVIKDASGNTIVTGNKDGLVISKGSISWENVTGTDDVATTDDIPTEEQITQITKNTVTTTYVNALEVTAKKVSSDWVYAGELEADQIKSGKLTSTDGKSAVIDLDNNSVRFGTSLSYVDGKLTLGDDVTISWGQITDTDDIATKDDVNNAITEAGGITEDQVTEISRNEIKTAKISADQIYGNTLTLGGKGNASGTLVINDEDGNAVVTGDNNGLSASNATINGDITANNSIKIYKSGSTATIEFLWGKDTQYNDSYEYTPGKGCSYTFANLSVNTKVLQIENTAKVLLSESLIIENFISAKYINSNNLGASSADFQEVGAGKVDCDTLNVYTEGVFQAPLIPQKGSYVHTASGTGGSTGYVKIARIKITDTYMNAPIILHVLQRGMKETTISIRFKNVDSTDPTIDAFTYAGNPAVYLYKASTSTWDLYIEKTESYDRICVSEYYNHPFNASKMSLTWTDEHASSLPSGYVSASLYIQQDTGWVTISSFQNSFTQCTKSSWAATCAYRRTGNRIYIRGHITTPSSWDNSSLVVFNLPSGYRPSARKYILNPMTGARIARFFVSTDGNVYLEWTKSISDGSNVSGALDWISIDMDFEID